MHIEYEIKVLGIEPEAIRETLEKEWAQCLQPLRRMQRYAFAHPTNKNAYIRIRQEGDKCTTTYKEHDDNQAVDSVYEIDVVIDNPEGMRNIYLKCGLREKAFQETYRESWVLDGVDVTIDRWPGLRPFIEVEGHDAASVNRIITRLWLDDMEQIWGTVSDVYHRELNIPHDIINEMPIITFDNPPVRYTA
jgi:adenylate cyclase, class 2